MLNTKRLTIRRLSLNDADLMLAILTDAAFKRYVGDRGVNDLDAAKQYLQDNVLSSYRRDGFGMFRVARRSNDQAIGICGLVNREQLPGIDIGFAFLPEYCGAGFGYESAQAVLDYARIDLALPNVLAIVSPDNQPSIALLKKLGFVYQRMHSLSPDDETALYQLDWV